MCGHKKYSICFAGWHQVLALKAAKNRDIFLGVTVIPSLCSKWSLRRTTKILPIPLIFSSFLVHPMPTSITSTGTLQPNQLSSITQTAPCSYLPLISCLFQPHHFNNCFHDLVLYRFVSAGQSRLSLPLTSMRAEVTMWPFAQTRWLSGSKVLGDIHMGRKGTYMHVYSVTVEGKEVKNQKIFRSHRYIFTEDWDFTGEHTSSFWWKVNHRAEQLPQEILPSYYKNLCSLISA